MAWDEINFWFAYLFFLYVSKNSKKSFRPFERTRQTVKKRTQQPYQQLKHQNLTTTSQNGMLKKIENNEMIEMIEIENMKKANDLIFRHQEVNKNLYQIIQVTKQTNYSLKKQGFIIQEIKGDLNVAESQLSMGDQLIRTMKNRDLKCKLILILWMTVVGVIDIFLLFHKLI